MKNCLRPLGMTLALSGAACGADDVGANTAGLSLACFHTDTNIRCVQAEDAGALAELRVRVEDFYPSVCFAHDSDDDDVPDFMEIDDERSSGDDASSDDEAELRCKKCNRGPGTQDDFRLEIVGNDAELGRGRVFSREGDTLTVPTPDGVLTITMSETTSLEDGEPTPGAEIRVRGTLSGENTIDAVRIDILCEGATPVPDETVPEEAEEVPSVPLI